MNKKLVGTLLLLLASGGCCSCDSSCDYLPPVLDGPYSPGGARTGSAGYHGPAPVESVAITPLQEAE